MSMKASKVKKILDAEVICGEEYLDQLEIDSAFGADMMSDVLAFVRDRTLFLTGLLNAHVIRTAEMIDLRVVVFVRGKHPTDEIIDMAKELDMVILRTSKTMFTSCGLLYEAGLRGCERGTQDD